MTTNPLKHLVFIIALCTLLSGCSAAIAVAPAVTQTSAITLASSDLVVTISGVNGSMTIDQVVEAYPEIFLDYPVLADVAHAEARHGVGIVDMVDNCLKQKGAIKVLFNPETKRTANVCLDDMGHFLVKIVGEMCDGDSCVTAFMKEKMHLLDQVINYLKNRGYQ